MVTRKIYLKSTAEALDILGQHDDNLRRLEQSFGVQIFVRQSSQSGDFTLVVRGAAGKVERALDDIEAIRQAKNIKLPEKSVPQAAKSSGATDPGAIYVTFHGRHIKPRSEQQKKYVDFIPHYDLVIATGPAGTGKTFLAVACALKALSEGRVSRIVLTRPVVEAGEKLGFLPGDLYEKINPYLKPLYDAFFAMLGTEKFRFMREEETIEIVPLAYMRGRTIDDAFVILDEAQNSTEEQMKMFLTRIGQDSQIVITGDTSQIDLDDKRKSGLVAAEKILADVEGIKIVRFSEDDVVRHPLVKKIIKAYGAWDKKAKPEVKNV
ncbi:MAG TPA: PhoH family protein [Elusimicrobia bacterium]|nr:MAG: hypothetical protein A2278_02570 [Elusimicrobia bacterium RIFOXYA12_FULL_49_49]OGS16366.1 MAG: hypothetical protein A2251_06020 [Elusimicrobia bacterium RIFOXYA2_FULL_47_53]OGS27254.1 MAG: hypothetical protein A2339_08155 [Elusimicrobia bacterium RIFOXYB12_FULL_50_12]OGS30456.1 MAG: hypothetical protein A2323_03015 [Elusimicrobia bacterium RIFOXYB2_FULL_46_23]HBU69446.1 PhoH family protein [Elusimicrobiota bacterium]